MFRKKIPLRRLLASILIILFLGFLCVSQPALDGTALTAVQLCGGILISLAALIRMLSSIYIAGYKNRRLITRGTYSLSRNPLYLCWLCGAAGIGLAVGSLLISLVLAVTIFLIYDKAIRLEEKRLSKFFPQEFNSYACTTPRWFGLSSKVNFQLTHPPHLGRIFQALLEGLSLFLIYPLRFSLTEFQNGDIFPILFYYF